MPAKCGSSPRAKVGIDLVGEAVGAGQAHVERPLLLLAPALARTAAPRLRAPSSLAWRACRSRDDGGARAPAPARARPCANGASVDRASCDAPLAWLSCWLRRRAAWRSASTGTALSRRQVEIVGDDGAEALRRLRIDARACRTRSGGCRARSASLRSWVTMITVMPCSRHSGAISACICARVPGSSAPNGSSSSSTRGSRASAWAIARRCCMPPESALGYLSRCVAEADRLEQRHRSPRSAARRAPAAQPRRAPGCRRIRSRPARCRAPSDAETPNSAGTRCRGRDPARPAAARRRAGSRRASARSWPRIRRRNVLLPQPDGPTIETKAPDGDLEVDALEHDLVAVFDPDVADRDRAHQRRSSSMAQGNAARDRRASARSITIGQQA